MIVAGHQMTFKFIYQFLTHLQVLILLYDYNYMYHMNVLRIYILYNLLFTTTLRSSCPSSVKDYEHRGFSLFISFFAVVVVAHRHDEPATFNPNYILELVYA